MSARSISAGAAWVEETLQDLRLPGGRPSSMIPSTFNRVRNTGSYVTNVPAPRNIICARGSHVETLAGNGTHESAILKENKPMVHRASRYFVWITALALLLSLGVMPGFAAQNKDTTTDTDSKSKKKKKKKTDTSDNSDSKSKSKSKS